MKILNTLQFIVYISAFVCRAFAATYYCRNKETINIDGESTGTIHTRASGAASYGNNVDCSWKINAGDSNKIHFKILSSVLEYTPPYTSCFTRDSLFLLSGDTPSSDILVSICGNFNPYEITSKGQYVYLRFSTNDKNFYQYSGISLQFQTFGNTSCPPEWRELSPSECFKIMKNPTEGLIWSKAQEHCGYSISNLIVIPTEDISTGLEEYAKNVSVDKFWIGLNDIETENAVKWIGGSSVYPSDKLQRSSISDTKDCVIYDTTEKKWVFKYCTREKFLFACQRHKEGETELFKIPEPIEEKDFAPVSLRWVIILSISGGIIFIILLTVLYCWLKMKRAKKIRAENNRRENYRPGTRTETPRSSFLAQNSTSNQREAHRSPRNSLSQDGRASPSPPSYEEAQLDYYIRKLT